MTFDQKKISFPSSNIGEWIALAQKESGITDPLAALSWCPEIGIRIPPVTDKLHTPIFSGGSIRGWKIQETHDAAEIPGLIQELNGNMIDELVIPLSEADLPLDRSSLTKSSTSLAFRLHSSLLPAITGLPHDFLYISDLQENPDILSVLAEIKVPCIHIRQKIHEVEGSLVLSSVVLEWLQWLIRIPNTCKHSRIHLLANDQFLEMITRIRALRIVLANILKAVGLAGAHMPLICLEIKANLNEDISRNLISMSSQALAGVTSGVDIIEMEVPKSYSESVVMKRLSRNIHYILRHETGLPEVADPLYGSFNLDEYLRQLSTQVWEKIKGGPAIERASGK